ncbi:MAG: hypothetical protein V3V99_11290 [candidate division Zixibacteria bacterium]
MRKNSLIYRAVVVPLFVCFLQMIMAPSMLSAQPIECPYDKSNPALDNARISFKSLNYNCAEQEILDYLKGEQLTIEQKADAHVLLAAVYYAKLKNDKEKKARVIEQFKAAFESYRDWRGELDISSTEFIEMMNEAKTLVDEEAEQKKPPVVKEVTSEPALETPTITETEEGIKKSKPWYTKWWAIGLGVGVVAAVVVAASGGGGDEEPVDNTLPGFPDPPASKK